MLEGAEQFRGRLRQQVQGFGDQVFLLRIVGFAGGGLWLVFLNRRDAGNQESISRQKFEDAQPLFALANGGGVFPLDMGGFRGAPASSKAWQTPLGYEAYPILG